MAFKTFSEKLLLILKNFSNALNPGFYSFKKKQFSLINSSIFAKILDLSHKDTTTENSLLQIKFYTVKKTILRLLNRERKKVIIWPEKNTFFIAKKKN